MSNYISFADGELIEIEDGAFLDEIKHVAETEQDAIAFCEKVTSENLNEVRFYGSDKETPSGFYTDLDLITPPTVTNRNGKFIATICLRETEATHH